MVVTSNDVGPSLEEKIFRSVGFETVVKSDLLSAPGQASLNLGIPALVVLA